LEGIYVVFDVCRVVISLVGWAGGRILFLGFFFFFFVLLYFCFRNEETLIETWLYEKESFSDA
jgi:hypothetical protein